MNKYVLSTLLLLGLSISAFAVQTTPLNNKGLELDPKYGGVSVCEYGGSSGTVAILCSSAPSVILDILISSVATTNYLTFRDSASATVATSETFRVDALSVIYPPKVYPRMNNGISVNGSSTNLGSAGMWSIVYTKDLK